MSVDLFGDIIEKKKLTSIQRIATRQAESGGRDLYTTEPKDIERFLKAIERDELIIRTPIWEPAAGHGDISKTLYKNGYSLIHSSDIIPYEDDDINIVQRDFLLQKDAGSCQSIFTNPPFNMQEDFLLHALKMNIDVILFVRLSFLSSIRRFKIYQTYPPSYVYIYSARAHCYKNGNREQSQNMVDYCVMWWKPYRPHRYDTILRWIE
jgi:hypothetical protein